MPIDIGTGGISPPPGGSFLGGFGALTRMTKRIYDPERMWRALGPQRQGSMTGGLTYDHIYDLGHNPLKYTVLSPSRDLAGEGLASPILGARSGERPRTGSFTLDMLDWNANLAQLTGSTLGLGQPLIGPGSVAAEAGPASMLPEILRDPMNYLSERDINPMSNAPARLFDYAFALHDIALQGMGFKQPEREEDVPHQYPFQKQGSYWAFIRSSTPEQRSQMAEYMADRSIDRSRNAYLRDELVGQFQRDFDSFDALSSGNVRHDYMAKKMLEADLRAGLAPGESGPLAMMGLTRDPQTGQLVKRAGGRTGELPGFKVGGMTAMYLPFVGTEAGAFFDPVPAELEKTWRTLPTEMRQKYLESAGFYGLTGDIIGTLPLFYGVGAVAGIARAGSFGTIASKLGASAKTVELLGRTGSVGKAGMFGARLYDATIKTSNLLMASGLTVATASWAAQSFAPHDSPIAALGRRIDASRVVSNSTLAGVVNTTGFLTGFYGIETAVPLWFRGARTAAGRLPKVDLEMGPYDLSYHREMGGTQIGTLLHRHYGIDWNLQGTALGSSFLSYGINRRKFELGESLVRLSRGEQSGFPDIDSIVDPVERLAFAEGLLAMEAHNIQGDLANVYGALFGAARAPRHLAGGPAARKFYDSLAKMARAVDDDNTQTMLGDLGERFFPSDLAVLRNNAARYLGGLGKSQDLAAMDRALGTDMTAWKQMDRRLHTILFTVRNAEMHTAAEGSLEAGRIGIASQRSLFSDEIDDFVGVLADSTAPERGQELYNWLVRNKDQVQDLEAKGVFDKPEGLALTLTEIAPLLQSRRRVGPSSSEGLLNDFQNAIETEGFWTIGYKPTGTWTLPEGWVRGGMEPPPGTQRLALSSDDLRDMGMRPFSIDEVMPGTDFNRREKVWPVHEYGGGVWVSEIPGEQIRTTANPPAAGGPSRAGVYEYATPPVAEELHALGRPEWTDPAGMDLVPTYPLQPALDVTTLTGETLLKRAEEVAAATRGGVEIGGKVRGKTGMGVRATVHVESATGGRFVALANRAGRRDTSAFGDTADEALTNLVAHMESGGDGIAPPGGRIAGRPVTRSGQNAGADWPVLEDAVGQQWLFKARYGYPQTSLNPARRLSAPTVGKLLEYLGMRTGKEIPWEWNGLDGTIQPFFEGASEIDISPSALAAAADTSSLSYNPELLPTLQQHQVVDWLTSQYDTNAGSFLDVGGYEPIAVDKGQAWRDFGKPYELEAFYDATGASWWTFRGPALNPNINDILFDAHNAGIKLDRGQVEQVLQRIEAIPEQTFRDWLTPLAEGRVAAGMNGSVDEFLDLMVLRRDGMRVAVNRAYEYIGGIRINRPTEMQTFKPGQTGTYRIDLASERINESPPLSSDAGSFPEVPLAVQPDGTPYRLKVGVVIEESDGRLWMVEPKNHYQGVMGEFPRGRVDPDDFVNAPIGTPEDHILRWAALREAREESGMSVTLLGHLTDIVNDGRGSLTRYFVAKRTGGGPLYAQPKETEAMWLGSPSQITTQLQRIETGTGNLMPNEPELDVLRAYMDLRYPGHAAGTKAPDPLGDPNAGLPGDPVDGDEFLSYVKLANGVVFRSPWLDYPMAHPDLIEMGNRSVFGQKLDSVFRGWRTYRIEQGQRAALHRRLSRLVPSLTPARIDRLHETLLDISTEVRVPPQATVLAQPWMPFAQVAVNKVDDAIKDAVGTGPWLRGDGTIGDVNWRRELANAYRLSHKMNMTAGLTSALYTMGPPGAGMSFISHVVYPALRFGLSPIFKLGEITESPLINALRGVNPFGGDPFTEAQMIQAGVTHQRGQIRMELSSEPMLQGMTSFSVVRDIDNYGPRTMLFTSPLPEGANLNAQRRMEDAMRGPQDFAPARGLYPDPAFAETYPDTFPDLGIDAIVPRAGVDETGAPILDFSGKQSDDAMLQANFDQWLNDQTSAAVVTGQDVEADLHEFLAGIAFVESLGDDFIPRLARAMTPVHTSSSRTSDIFARIKDGLENGTVPLAGAPGRGRSAVKGETTTLASSAEVPEDTAAGMLFDSDTMPSTSPSELAMGHVDAYYAGMGVFSGGYGDSVTFVLNDKVWRQSVIFNGDRIGFMSQGPSVFNSNMVTPSGAYRLISQKLFQALHGYGAKGGTDKYAVGVGNDLAGQHIEGFHATGPLEVAVPGGSHWSDIEAIVVPDHRVQDWLDLVATYGDDVPGLKDIKVVTTSGNSVESALAGYWFEKAGLLDRRFPDIAPFRNASVGTYTHLLPSDMVTPQLARKIIETLGIPSYESPLTALAGQPGGAGRFTTVLNMDDQLRLAIRLGEVNLRDRRGSYEAAAYVPDKYSSHNLTALRDSVARAEAAVDDGKALLADMRAFRSTKYGQAFSDLASAEAAMGTGAETAAAAWIAGFTELRARLQGNKLMAGSQPSSYEATLAAGERDALLSAKNSQIVDLVSGEKKELPEWDRQPTDISYITTTLGDQQAVEYARFLLDKFKQVSHEGFRHRAGNRIAFDNEVAANWFRDSLAPMAFLDELQRAATARMGRDPGGLPIVHAWIRGSRKFDTTKSDAEVVITVMGPDGQAYGGLRLDEIGEIWRRTALPARQGAMVGADPMQVMSNQHFEAMWTPDGGPDGSLVWYDQVQSFAGKRTGSFVEGPDGLPRYIDATLPPERYIPVRFLYAFKPRPEDAMFTNLTTDKGYATWRFEREGMVEDSAAYGFFDDSLRYNRTHTPTAPRGDRWELLWVDPNKGTTKYSVSGQLDPIVQAEIVPNAATGPGAAAALWDVMLDKIDPTRIARITVAHDAIHFRRELAARHVRGEIPQTWAFIKRGAGWDTPSGPSTHAYDEVMTDADFQIEMGVPPNVANNMMPEPPPSDLADIPGSAEHLTDQLGKWLNDTAAKGGAKARAAAEAWWNPIPFKEHQQDKLIGDLVRDRFPQMVREFMPDVYNVLAKQLGVPDPLMLTYLVRDRQLLAQWHKSGARADFDALVMHAEQHRPVSAKDVARGELDTLYSKPEWTSMMEVLRMTSRAASDEAFGAHFFMPYRSSFERSINHPLLGVYPASWAYKMAKEWWRFLFDNDMLKGFRLGMTPAVWISQMREQQQVAFAQMTEQDLDKWYKEGPLSSSVFLWNLLMPGDWSALPFPLSRSLRDAIRGNLDPAFHFQNNIAQMGLGRDFRLSGELAAEWSRLATGQTTPFHRGEEMLQPGEVLPR